MVIFFLFFITTQLATHAAHTLIFNNNMGNVRATSLLTLIFIGLTFPFTYENMPALHAIFLGATFVGVTDPTRLSRKQLSIASFIFSLIFQFLIVYLKGFGGALGLAAFLSCLVTFWLGKRPIHADKLIQ
jgi:hypothetical protein